MVENHVECLNVSSLESHNLITDLLWCYKIVFGLFVFYRLMIFFIRSLLNLRALLQTLKWHTCVTKRSFFSEPVTSV